MAGCQLPPGSCVVPGERGASVLDAPELHLAQGRLLLERRPGARGRRKEGRHELFV